MNKNKLPAMFAILALLLAAMFVAGCTSSATNEATPTPTSSPVASPTTTPVPTQAPTATPTAAPTVTAKPTTSDLPWIDYDFHWSGNGAAVLTINGNVANTQSLSMADLKTYGQHYLSATSGTKSANGTGPYLSELLAAAGVKSGSTTVTFISSDSPPYTKAITLADLNGPYAGGIVAILDDGKLRLILPGGAASGTWVRNLVTITVS